MAAFRLSIIIALVTFSLGARGDEVWLRCAGTGSPDLLSDPDVLEDFMAECPSDVEIENCRNVVQQVLMPAFLASGGIKESFEWSETLILNLIKSEENYAGSISSEKLEHEEFPIFGELTDSHYRVRVACNEKDQCWDRIDVDRATLAFKRGKRLFTETDNPMSYFVSIDGACEIATPRI